LKYSGKTISLLNYLASNGNLVSVIRETSFPTFPLCLFSFTNPREGKLVIFGNFVNFVAESANSAIFFPSNEIYSERNLGLFKTIYETKIGPFQTKYRPRPFHGKPHLIRDEASYQHSPSSSLGIIEFCFYFVFPLIPQ